MYMHTLLIILVYIVAFIGIFIALFYVFARVIDRWLRAKPYQGPVTDHFDGTKFINLKDAAKSKSEQTPKRRSGGFLRILRWMLSRKKSPWVERTVPQTRPEQRVQGASITATFINHATVLMPTEGLNIIPDPIYARRASPFSFAGPKRYANPGVAFEDLPPIDVILLSHNHYDHLDIATLKKLIERGHPRLIVPLGNKDYLARYGISVDAELDWWDSREFATGISVTCVAAQHFSALALSDRNKTLWCGYVIRTPHGDIYFSGDTGFGPFVDQIAQRFPNGFRFGSLPVGAFKPAFFMGEVHVSPNQAFEMQEQLKVQQALAIHFGTFNLADDGQDEPMQIVDELAKSLPNSKRFLALPNGGVMQVD